MPTKNSETLSTRLMNPGQFVTLYSTTPPRANTDSDRIATAATRLAERVLQLPADGLVVYDVQDESDRTTVPRPFPFLPTIESRIYSQILQQLTGLSAITYKCVVNMTDASWLEWLTETRHTYGITYLSLVGSSTPNPAPHTLPVDRAIQLTSAHEGRFTLGGVVIPERHTTAYNESYRLRRKAEQGCHFFISQIVYQAEATIHLLNDYVADCRRWGIKPSRIVLTFTPCGRPKTMEFLKWLGVAISPDTEHTIMADPAPFKKSIEICCANLRAILDQPYIEEVPLGFNIESVSIHKDEIEASTELFHALCNVARTYGLSVG